MDREPDPDGGSELGEGPRPDASGPGAADPGAIEPDEFDAIVAGWLREGDVPVWPVDGLLPDEIPPSTRPDVEQDPDVRRPAAPLFDAAPSAPDAPPPTPPPPAPARPADVHRPPEPVDEDDEHFVPPEPPPLPRIGPPALVGLTFLVLGLVLIWWPGWVGVPTTYGVPLGLVSIASGLGWLVLRLWPDHSADGPDEDDDGAIL
ncbi:MAG: hypothetical protein QOF00_1049 [Pseudonocardiales bacterium]|jgi:hypothetical protein|nr:hypothetical protein [Pseudonocardiales bacterium]